MQWSTFSTKEAVRTNALQVLQGLEFMHEQAELVHGDINTKTIFVSHEGVVKIGTEHHPYILALRATGNLGETQLIATSFKQRQDDIGMLKEVVFFLLAPGQELSLQNLPPELATFIDALDEQGAQCGSLLEVCLTSQAFISDTSRPTSYVSM